MVTMGVDQDIKEQFPFEDNMRPVWSGNEVYEESVMFFPEPDTGKVLDAPLLYHPIKILEARSADHRVVYREGIDYALVDGCIRRLPSGSIPLWEYDDLYMPEKPDKWVAAHSRAKGRYLRILEGVGFAQMQMVVTYVHDEAWMGPVPAFAGKKLPKTLYMLQKKQPLRVVFFGDSILSGQNASSLFHCAPFTPTFAELFIEKLKRVYGYEGIEAFNTSVGGMDSAWGVGNAEQRVAAYDPDLCVIGFGMNDHFSKEQEEQHIRTIIETAREKNPNMEAILLSSHLPNPDSGNFAGDVAGFAEVFRKISEDIPGVAVAPMTAMHTYMLTRKRYLDMSGNGINHPNDFLIRVHAQCLVQCVVE